MLIRYRSLFLLFIVMTCAALVFVAAQALQAKPLAAVQETVPEIGVPCGSGELLSNEVICLHGTISLFDENGLTPLDAVTVTASYAGATLTSTTFIHPGDITPTYGIDLSPLQPTFLQPITLTAIVSGQAITRYPVIFPDFATHNQQFDIVIDTASSFAAIVQGQVIEFSANSPITGALITASSLTSTITTTTRANGLDGLPGYSFESTDAFSSGDIVTLTATYNGDTDFKVIRWPAENEPLTLHFVTGWKCDDFDPFPNSSGAWSFPNSSGAWSFPDVACIWGYVLDEVPLENAEVQVKIGVDIYEGRTVIFPGEILPRYAVAIPQGASLLQQTMQVAANQLGQTALENVSLSLDTQLSQRVDLTMPLLDFDTEYFNWQVEDLLVDGDTLWIATQRGLVRQDIQTKDYYLFTTADGLISDRVYSVDIDSLGNYWVGTASGVMRYKPSDPVGSQWVSISPFENGRGPGTSVLEVAPDDSVWFNGIGSNGIYHYMPTAPIGSQWESFGEVDGLASDAVRAIAFTAEGDILIGGNKGLSLYRPDANENEKWTIFTEEDGLLRDSIWAIEVYHDDSIWIGTVGGISRYMPEEPIESQWENYQRMADLGIISNFGIGLILSIAIGDDNSVWFGRISNEPLRYDPNAQPEDQWTTYSISDGVGSKIVDSLTADSESNIWFGTRGQGVNKFNRINLEWEQYTHTDGLISTTFSDIFEASDGDVWFATSVGVSRYSPANDSWNGFTTANSLTLGRINDIAEDDNNSMWFVGDNGVSKLNIDSVGLPNWQTFSCLDVLPDCANYSIAVDRSGKVWIGGLTNISIYDHTKSSGERWSYLRPEDGLQITSIYSIFEDSDGAMWLGGRNGINRYESEAADGQEWALFTTAEGLGNEFTFAIVEDDFGALWFGGENGISVYAMDAPTGTQWSHHLSGAVRDLSLSSNGAIWSGGDDGVRYFTHEAATEDELRWSPYFPGTEFGSNSFELTNDGVLWADAARDLAGRKQGIIRLTQVEPQPDLSIVIQTEEFSTVSATVHTIVHVTNYGELASDALLTVTLPPASSILSASVPISLTNPFTAHINILQSQESASISIASQLGPEYQAGDVYEIKGDISTSLSEDFIINNSIIATGNIVDPQRANLAISIYGPAVLPANSVATYTVLVDNAGGLAAENSIVQISLPPGLAAVEPDALSIGLGTLPSVLSVDASLVTRTFALSVSSDLTTDMTLTVSGIVSTTTEEIDLANNMANATLPVSIADAQSLFLLAPTRLAAQYGTSSLLNSLYTLSQHPLVEGVVLDIEQDEDVAAAYAAWDADPSNTQLAKQVAQAIEVLLDSYSTSIYPELRYVTIVGGDSVIPYCRVKDQSRTNWRERTFAGRIARGTQVRAALNGDYFLTDDCYASRTNLVPETPFWFDDHVMTLPDLAIGRIVETPTEMIATIQAFLASDGTISLTDGRFGGDVELASDWSAEQCSQLDGAGLTCSVNNSSSFFNAGWDIANQWSGIGLHSSHRSMGSSFSVGDLQALQSVSNQALVTSLGCHVGLNVPDNGSDNSKDWAQTFVGKGIPFVGATAYAYGSRDSIGYSERLLQLMTEEVLATESIPVGIALANAKRSFYQERADWFNFTDEKVALAMTLYGLPMLEIVPIGSSRATAETYFQLDEQQSVQRNALPSVQVTLSQFDYTLETTTDGSYYRLGIDTDSRTGMPIQPQTSLEVTATITGHAPHGVILTQATYTIHPSFDPIVEFAWAYAEPTSGLEPTLEATRWDTPPHSFSTVAGELLTTTKVPLVTGAYDAVSERELLLDFIELDVRYGDPSGDTTAPVIETAGVCHDVNATHFAVVVSDNEAISEVSVVYDDDLGTWRQVALSESNGVWDHDGTLLSGMTRYFVQAVDGNGNVVNTQWLNELSSSCVPTNMTGALQQVGQKSQNSLLAVMVIVSLMILTARIVRKDR